VTKFQAHPPDGRTFSHQHEFPRLPISPHMKQAADELLVSDGPRWQEHLKEYAEDKARCMPMSLLALYINDPTPDRSSQLPSTTSLIFPPLASFMISVPACWSLIPSAV
ncbi:uncharacterized protein LAESUDRAFT_786443, partial [Laetiporus sulphureus 93-53]